MINVEVTLHWFETTRGTSDTIIEAASASCFRDCIKDTNIYLLEPIVSLEVTVDENYQRVVLDDLNRRRFVLEIIDVRHGNKVNYMLRIVCIYVFIYLFIYYSGVIGCKVIFLCIYDRS